MTINDLQISLCGVFPEMACAEMEELLHMVQALSAEGLSHLTVSFDPEHFPQQAAAVSGRTPDFSLGAGPLTTEEVCRQAIACGAEFVLTTEFTPALVEYGSERKAAIIPICSNCAEAERAMALGCTILRCTVSLDELEGIFRLTEAAEPIVMLLLDGEAAEAALRAPSGKRALSARCGKRILPQREARVSFLPRSRLCRIACWIFALLISGSIAKTLLSAIHSAACFRMHSDLKRCPAVSQISALLRLKC